MAAKISIPLKNLKKSSFDLAEKPFDSKLSGEWIAYTDIEDVFLSSYIQEKFKQSIHILPFTHFTIMEDFELEKTVLVIGDTNLLKLVFFGIDNVEPYLKKYRNTSKRFTYYPISIAETQKNSDSLLYHAISAIYDKQNNKVEIFDSINTDFTPFKKTFKDLFCRIYNNKTKIVYIADRCVAFGKLEYSRCDKSLYKYKSKGFCAVWTYWFLELRLSNPGIPKEKLIEKALKRLKQGDKVCKFLRGYAQFVQDVVSKFSIVRTSSNLLIKPKTSKRPAFTKRDYSFLYVLLASLVGSVAAFGVLRRLEKK